jgi:hypothetical protein
MNSFKKICYPIAVLTPLICLWTAFWAPALFHGKSLVHGDSIMHGLSLWEYFSRNLHHYDNLIWDRYTYGGHPLFAEGQGGFAFPLKILLAGALDPIYANNFAHWIEMIFAGAGTYLLGRKIQLSQWSAGFAAVGVTFSSYWILLLQNMTLSTASMCIPWMLLAAEHWIRFPSWKSASLLGISAALAVLAGYPHCLHGSIIYIAVSLCVRFFDTNIRLQWRSQWRTLLKTGMLAIIIGLGLAAIQLLPLLELVGYSHRSGGTSAFFFKQPLALYLRGLLYNLHAHELESPIFVPVIGSALICLLFSLCILFKSSMRIKAHIIASLFLLGLGLGGTSPLTQFIYNHHLLPGLHYFRLMSPYFLVANVGICLIAAYSIDQLSMIPQTLTRAHLYQWLKGHKFSLPALLSLWIAILIKAPVAPTEALKQWAFAGAAIVGVVLLHLNKKITAAPFLFFIILIIETALLKLHEYQFVDPAILSKPASAKLIQESDLERNYKLYSSSSSYAYLLGSPLQSNLAHKTQVMLSHICGLSSVRWDLPSMMGSLALPSHGWGLIDPLLSEEVMGRSNSPIGSRLIDILAVKFIVADAPVDADSFSLKFHDPATNTWLLENTAAKPRFQAYSHFVFVNSPEEALQVLRTAHAPILALETPKFADRKLLVSTPLPAAVPADDSRIQFTLTKDDPTDYQLNIKAEHAGWLFLADANYPGWHAYIDGVETPVFTGQVLGKAIAIPSGEHRLDLRFISKTFLLGRNISLLTLVLIFTGIALAEFRRRLHGRTESLRPADAESNKGSTEISHRN